MTLKKPGPRKRIRARPSFRTLISHGRECPYCARVMRVPLKGIRLGKTFPADFPTRDHVIPKSRMPAQGTLMVCHKCNHDKANRTLPEWAQYLDFINDPRASIIRKLMHKEHWREHPTFSDTDG